MNVYSYASYPTCLCVDGCACIQINSVRVLMKLNISQREHSHRVYTDFAGESVSAQFSCWASFTCEHLYLFILWTCNLNSIRWIHLNFILYWLEKQILQLKSYYIMSFCYFVHSLFPFSIWLCIIMVFFPHSWDVLVHKNQVNAIVFLFFFLPACWEAKSQSWFGLDKAWLSYPVCLWVCVCAYMHALITLC